MMIPPRPRRCKEFFVFLALERVRVLKYPVFAC
jgi:hypothetical protein